MIWLTWRQHRAQFIGGAALCGLLLILLLFTGSEMRSTYDSLGLSACLNPNSAPACPALMREFTDQYSGFQFLLPLFLLLPALLGLFWGAPLIAREVEQGTHRLAWTQSVSRRRWLLSKLSIIAVVALALASVYSAMLWWWADPLVAAGSGRFAFGLFDLFGIVPVAYALFAVALGVAAGVVIQRTTSAMVATFFGFAAVRLAVELWLRPNYQKPLSVSYAFFVKGTAGASTDPPPGSWLLTQDTVTRAGVSVSGGGSQSFAVDLLHRVCPSLPPGFPSATQLQQCVAQQGIHFTDTIQPSDRYWLFQGIESALFVALATALIGFSIWWVRRRVR